jgi:hypothetical protein
MSDLYDQIISQRGSLERLIGRLPGFEGYLDKKARRTADRLLRDYIAGQIATRITRLTQIEKKLLDNDGLSFMSKTNSAKTKLQTYHDKVKTAAPGYSGPFEAVKITEQDLEALYSFDEAQIRYVDQIDAALNKLEEAVTAKSGIDEAIAEIEKVTQEAQAAFSLRDDVVTNLGKSLSG